jgi:hypothetical protein
MIAVCFCQSDVPASNAIASFPGLRFCLKRTSSPSFPACRRRCV